MWRISKKGYRRIYRFPCFPDFLRSSVKFAVLPFCPLRTEFVVVVVVVVNRVVVLDVIIIIVIVIIIIIIIIIGISTARGLSGP